MCDFRESEFVNLTVKMNALSSDLLNKDDQLSMHSNQSANESVSLCLLKVPPIPKPRLSLLSKKVNSLNTRSNSVPDCTLEQTNCVFPQRPPRRKSECPHSVSQYSYVQSTANCHCNSTFDQKDQETEKNDSKSYSQSTLRKFGNIFKSKKFSSLRRSSKDKSRNAEDSRPIRPKRSPPLPPKNINFRPAAPLPVYCCQPEVYEHGPTLTYYDRDSVYTSDSDLYATVAESNSLQDTSDHYEDLSDYEKRTESDYDDDLYQDAYQCKFIDEDIYEILPGEEHSSSDLNSQQELFVEADNNYCRKIKCNVDRKLQKIEKKRALRAAKLRKKFNLTGTEIPVNVGVVIEDAKGAGSDLLVNKGEVVLILRMERNPPGKWLVKNERDKIGFVDLQNIDVDPESIKSLMKIPALYET